MGTRGSYLRCNIADLFCPQIADMFKLADKDSTGSITFDEFYTFLQTDSKKEAAKQKDHAIVAIADPVAAQQARMNTPGYALRSLASQICETSMSFPVLTPPP